MDYKLRNLRMSHRGASVLRLTPHTRETALKRPVVMLHGLGGTKERMLPVMYAVAQAGFDVSAIDLYLHGDRPEAEHRQRRLDTEFLAAMLDVTYQTAEDVPPICAEIGVDLAQAGIVGVSAGGFAAHVMAMRRPQFKAMVAVISSPDWLSIDPTRTPDATSPEGQEMQRISPVNSPELYPPIALCLLNNVVDDTVSAVGSEVLYERLRPIYREQGILDKLSATFFQEYGHFYSDEMVARTVAWLDRHL